MGVKEFFKDARNFFFPKDFIGEVRKGMLRESSGKVSCVGTGMDVVRKKSERWFTFFMWLPVVGNIIFYIEGKRSVKKKHP